MVFVFYTKKFCVLCAKQQTLIASMASLISYKIYAHNYNKTKGRYLLWFTIANVLFLAVLVLVYVFIS